jgi:hypothetical protein
MVNSSESNRHKTIDVEVKDRRWETIRKQVLERDNYTCQRCGRTDKILSVHHNIPRQVGGTDELENLISLCHPCHRTEEWNAEDFEEWRMWQQEDFFIPNCSICGESIYTCLDSCDCAGCIEREKWVEHWDNCEACQAVHLPQCEIGIELYNKIWEAKAR